MPRRTYDDRKGRRRPPSQHVTYAELIAELNSNRFVKRPSGRNKQGDTQE